MTSAPWRESQDSPSTGITPIDPSQFNGYNKYMADLYRPWRETAIQITDPYNYYDRTVPNENFLHRYVKIFNLYFVACI